MFHVCLYFGFYVRSSWVRLRFCLGCMLILVVFYLGSRWVLFWVLFGSYLGSILVSMWFRVFFDVGSMWVRFGFYVG